MIRSTFAIIRADLATEAGRHEARRSLGAAIACCWCGVDVCLWVVALWGRG